MQRPLVALRWTGLSFFYSTRPLVQPRNFELTLLSNKNSIFDQEILEDWNLSNQISRISEEQLSSKKPSLYVRITDFYGQWMDSRFQPLGLQSNWLLFWNIINYFVATIIYIEILFILLIIIVIPDQQQLISATSIVFGVDMLLIRYRVKLLEHDILITTHSQIMKHYLVKMFPADLLSLIVISLSPQKYRFFWLTKVLIYFKYITTRQINKQIKYRLAYSKLSLLLYSFFKFILVLVFWTFLYACIYLIIDLSYLQQKGWYYDNGFLWLTGSPSLHFFNLFQHFQWYIWFQYSLFFVMETVRGCGYGIVTPRNPSQFLFANLAMMTTLAMFAYFTKGIIDISVGFSFQKNHTRTMFAQDMMQIKKYYSVTGADRQKYRSYVLVKQSKRQRDMFVLAELALSFQLLQKFHYISRKHGIFSLPFLVQLSQEDPFALTFRVELSQIISSKTTCFNEFLLRTNAISQETLFISQNAYLISENVLLKKWTRLQMWEYAGGRQFFINKRSICDLYTPYPAKILYFNKSEFHSIIIKYPLIYDNFCQLMDNIKLQVTGTENLKMKCMICNQYHLYEQCADQLLHFDSKTKQTQRKEDFQLQHRAQKKRKFQKSQKIRSIYLPIQNMDVYARSRNYFVSYNF